MLYEAHDNSYRHERCDPTNKHKDFHYTCSVTSKRVTDGEAGPSPRHSAWATQLQKNIAAVAQRWRYCPI